MAPKISVLLPIRNGEKYIERAVQSILDQTFRDFEFLIFDDGSSDQTPSILKRLAEKDSRIKIITHEKGQGLANTLNEGLSLAKGEWIARMDGDDYALPTRFETQLKYFEKNSSIAILGSAVKNLGLGYPSIAHYPIEYFELWAQMFFACPFAHPSVMYNRKKFEEAGLRYDNSFELADDYELWTRVLSKYPGANLKDVYLHYQNHPGQVRVARGVEQDSHLKPIWRGVFARYGLQVTDEQLSAHQWVCTEGRWKKPSQELLKNVLSWVKVLSRTHFQGASDEQMKAFQKNLALRVLRIRCFFRFSTPEISKAFSEIKELPNQSLGIQDLIRSTLKGLLRKSA